MFHTRLCDLLGIKYPIIQGALGGISGDPRQPVVALLKEHGITVLPVVPTVRHAVRLEAEGADAIIASGTEAGGHVGSVCSLPLVPQVVSAVKLPVVAAGGIGDARGFVAALALGACGVQMGTRFLATHESGCSLKQKQRILEASEEDTRPTPIFTGRNVRVITSPELEEWAQRQRSGATPEELNALARRIRKNRQRSPETNVTAGQISGMIKQIGSAGDIINQIIDQATTICQSLGRLAAAD